eukprot:GHVP01050219.1.p1 GENE.GHVP01050219.1~~GHVP01050219.1.p1  ORF type:complete len:884 (-),score=186.42 GHVP01050219.1:122-2773(-)
MSELLKSDRNDCISSDNDYEVFTQDSIWYREFRTILQRLRKIKRSSVFETPVLEDKMISEDCKKVYRDVIKEPMDFYTVEKKINEGFYTEQKDFQKDIDLIFDNCMSFNAEGTEYHSAAKRGQSSFRNYWSKVLSRINKKSEVPKNRRNVSETDCMNEKSILSGSDASAASASTVASVSLKSKSRSRSRKREEYSEEEKSACGSKIELENVEELDNAMSSQKSRRRQTEGATKNRSKKISRNTTSTRSPQESDSDFSLDGKFRKKEAPESNRRRNKVANQNMESEEIKISKPPVSTIENIKKEEPISDQTITELPSIANESCEIAKKLEDTTISTDLLPSNRNKRSDIPVCNPIITKDEDPLFPVSDPTISTIYEIGERNSKSLTKIGIEQPEMSVALPSASNEETESISTNNQNLEFQTQLRKKRRKESTVEIPENSVDTCFIPQQQIKEEISFPINGQNGHHDTTVSSDINFKKRPLETSVKPQKKDFVEISSRIRNFKIPAETPQEIFIPRKKARQKIPNDEHSTMSMDLIFVPADWNNETAVDLGRNFGIPTTTETEEHPVTADLTPQEDSAFYAISTFSSSTVEENDLRTWYNDHKTLEPRQIIKEINLEICKDFPNPDFSRRFDEYRSLSYSDSFAENIFEISVSKSSEVDDVNMPIISFWTEHGTLEGPQSYPVVKFEINRVMLYPCEKVRKLKISSTSRKTGTTGCMHVSEGKANRRTVPFGLGCLEEQRNTQESLGYPIENILEKFQCQIYDELIRSHEEVPKAVEPDWFKPSNKIRGPLHDALLGVEEAYLTKTSNLINQNVKAALANDSHLAADILGMKKETAPWQRCAGDQALMRIIHNRTSDGPAILIEVLTCEETCCGNLGRCVEVSVE